MTTTIEISNKLRDMISAFKTPSHERGVLNGAVQELRRLAAVEQELAACKSRCNAAVGQADALRQELADLKASLGEPVGWLDADIDAIFTASDIDGGRVDGLVPLYAIEAKP